MVFFIKFMDINKLRMFVLLLIFLKGKKLGRVVVIEVYIEKIVRKLIC